MLGPIDPFGVPAQDHDDLPDLRDMSEEERIEALVPLTERERRLAVERIPDLDIAEGLALVGYALARTPVQGAVPTPRLPVPEVERASRRVWRQLNVKLSDEQYDAVARAAKRNGLRPTQLARMLVLRGVAQIERGG